MTSVLRASFCQSRSRRLAFDSVTSTRAILDVRIESIVLICTYVYMLTVFAQIIEGNSHPKGYDLFGLSDSTVSLVKDNAPG